MALATPNRNTSMGLVTQVALGAIIEQLGFQRQLHSLSCGPLLDNIKSILSFIGTAALRSSAEVPVTGITLNIKLLSEPIRVKVNQQINNSFLKTVFIGGTYG